MHLPGDLPGQRPAAAQQRGQLVLHRAQRSPAGARPRRAAYVTVGRRPSRLLRHRAQVAVAGGALDQSPRPRGPGGSAWPTALPKYGPASFRHRTDGRRTPAERASARVAAAGPGDQPSRISGRIAGRHLVVDRRAGELVHRGAHRRVGEPGPGHVRVVHVTGEHADRGRWRRTPGPAPTRSPGAPGVPLPSRANSAPSASKRAAERRPVLQVQRPGAAARRALATQGRRESASRSFHASTWWMPGGSSQGSEAPTTRWSYTPCARSRNHDPLARRQHRPAARLQHPAGTGCPASPAGCGPGPARSSTGTARPASVRCRGRRRPRCRPARRTRAARSVASSAAVTLA